MEDSRGNSEVMSIESPAPLTQLGVLGSSARRKELFEDRRKDMLIPADAIPLRSTREA